MKALNLDMSRIAFPMRNNHAHKLPGKVFTVVNSTIGWWQASLRCKFLVENYPTTFPWSKGYRLQNFMAFGRIVSKYINNKQTHTQTFFFIYIDNDVGEVSDVFEFFSEIFAQSTVPTMNCCVPDRA